MSKTAAGTDNDEIEIEIENNNTAAVATAASPKVAGRLAAGGVKAIREPQPSKNRKRNKKTKKGNRTPIFNNQDDEEKILEEPKIANEEGRRKKSHVHDDDDGDDTKEEPKQKKQKRVGSVPAAVAAKQPPIADVVKDSDDEIVNLTLAKLENKKKDASFLENVVSKLAMKESDTSSKARLLARSKTQPVENLQVRLEYQSEAGLIEIEEGAVVEISRTEADVTWTAPLFIRKHLVDRLQKLNSFMQSTEIFKLYATGAPGCGKTCFFFMWARMLMQHGRSVLFVQFRISTFCQIWVLEDMVVTKLAETTSKYVETVVIDLLNQRKTMLDLAVVDGTRMNESSCKDLVSALNLSRSKGHISKLVFVTSLQFRIPHGDEKIGLHSIAVKMSIDSWDEEDYEKAARSNLVKDPNLRNMLLTDWKSLSSNETKAGEEYIDEVDHEYSDDDKIREAVVLKYHYAGGCARFMFDMNIDRLKMELEDLCTRVKNWDEFTRTTVASSAEAVVNSLMQQFTTETPTLCVAVSKFVLLRAYETCRADLTSAIELVAKKTGNSSLKGWAFELSQLDIIRSVSEANRNVITKAVANSQLTFYPRSDTYFDGSEISGKSVMSGSVIHCLKWNQACFDVALYFEATLVTIQFSVARSHSLKLRHIKTLREALLAMNVNVNRIVHVGIGENAEEFSFHDVGKRPGTRSNPQVVFKVEVATSSKLKSIEDSSLHFTVVGGQEHCVY